MNDKETIKRLQAIVKRDHKVNMVRLNALAEIDMIISFNLPVNVIVNEIKRVLGDVQSETKKIDDNAS